MKCLINANLKIYFNQLLLLLMKKCERKDMDTIDYDIVSGDRGTSG